MRPWLAALLLLVTTGAAAPTLAGPADETRLSALVTLAGPSVSRAWSVPASSGGDAGAVLERARVASGRLAVLDATVRARQASTVAAVERLGAAVVSRYTTAANGLLVHATPDQLRSLARLPDVVRVERAPRLRPALAQSVPLIGADRLAAVGLDGTGTTVAVIDTGIDYTHADFGGPGTGSAYAAALSGAETIEDEWEGVPFFPTDKVIGGYDFVGPNYTAPEDCPPADERAGRCTSEPHPDDDPLDEHGHGTHTAGVVAGVGTTALHPGVAPGARLVALKIYGPPADLGRTDETIDVAVDAIEWCVRVNLGLETRGTMPADVPIDVINMSFGEDEGQGSQLFDDAIDAAVDAGIVVVASAGNARDQPYVAGAPATSPRALSVASASSGVAGYALHATPDDGPVLALTAIDGGISSQPLQLAGPLTAPLALFGRGCSGDAPADDVDGRIALVLPEGCTDDEKVRAAQAAGAVAAIVVSSQQCVVRLSGSGAGISVPTLAIDAAAGGRLQAHLLDDGPLTVTLDPARSAVHTGYADRISSFSSRGPSKHGALKPDLTAPGEGVVSATRGSGQGGSAGSGTSVAAPHVAGAAALIRQRDRTDALGLDARDIGALLMGTARPVVHEERATRAPAPVVRQGAGRLAVGRAAEARWVVRAGEIASLNLGAVSRVAPTEDQRWLTIESLVDEPLRLRVADVPRQDARPGVTVVPPAEPVAVPARGTVRVPLTFVLDPARLPAWPARGETPVSTGRHDEVARDGFITVSELDAEGVPIAERTASVPYYVLPRAAAAVWSTGYGPGGLGLRNDGPVSGRVELLQIPTGGTRPDPDEPAVRGELDLEWVGARLEDGPDGPQLVVGVTLHVPAAVPYLTQLELYLDTDRDGSIDYRARAGYQQRPRERLHVLVGRWDADQQQLAGGETVVGPWSAELHTRVRRIALPLSTIGLEAPAALDLYVIHRGLTEDWWDAPTVDVVPDGAADGARLTLEPTDGRPERWQAVVEAEGQLELGLADTSSAPAPLLALYPDNRFELAGAQVDRLEPGAQPNPTPGPTATPEPEPVFLPLLSRHHELYPKPPKNEAEQLVADALDALEGVERLRAVYDLRHRDDRQRSVQRTYELLGDEGMHMVARWETGQERDSEYIRWHDQGYYTPAKQGAWQCWPVEEHMVLWPELITRFREMFPEYGWANVGQQHVHGRLANQLRAFQTEPPAELKVFVDAEWGVPITLSVCRPLCSRADEMHVYWLKDYGASDIAVAPPRGVACP